jgi:hypothetical protein
MYAGAHLLFPACSTSLPTTAPPKKEVTIRRKEG